MATIRVLPEPDRLPVYTAQAGC